MKFAFKYAVLSLLAFLAACSSGLEAPAPTLAPQASTDLRVRVSNGNDDAEEVGGSVQVSSAALDFSANSAVGIRFGSVAIPRGATVTSAVLEFRASKTSEGSLTLTVRGDDSDSASTFSSKNLSSRSKTSASALWYPRTWTVDMTTRSSELKDVVQEIVDRDGWKSGNAMAFTITGSGAAARAAVSANQSQPYAPTLVVSYASGDVTAPPTTGGGTDSQTVWHSRLRSAIDSGRYQNVGDKSNLDPLYIARAGNMFTIGRGANMLETAYVLAYRETGDRKLMDFVNKFMMTLQGSVKDYDQDGFREILYKQPGEWYMKDTHRMDAMLSHGTLASLTLALKEAGYSSTASWWTNYLKNDFVRDWMRRGGMPYHGLTHPQANFIRFNYAMYKLTGDSSYLSTAKSAAVLLKKTIRSDGWAHWLGDTSGCAPTVYVPLTAIALADLSTNGSGLIDSATMKRAASTVAHKVMKNSSGTSLAGNNCGSGSYGSSASIATFSFTQMAAWDSSGRIVSISERVYNATERYRLSAPIRTPLPAALTFVKGR